MPSGALYPSKSGLMNKHIVKHIEIEGQETILLAIHSGTYYSSFPGVHSLLVSAGVRKAAHLVPLLCQRGWFQARSVHGSELDTGRFTWKFDYRGF